MKRVGNTFGKRMVSQKELSKNCYRHFLRQFPFIVFLWTGRKEGKDKVY